MKTTCRIEDASPALREWLTTQSTLARSPGAQAVDASVLSRLRAGPPSWVVGVVVFAGAVAGLGYSGLGLWRFGHALQPSVLLLHAAAWAAGLLVVAWSLGRVRT